MKKNCLLSSGFVLLEALFCLFLAGFALSLFAFYLSLPKTKPEDRISIYPQNQGVFVQKRIFETSNLLFETNEMQLQEGGQLYRSFEVLQ